MPDIIEIRVHSKFGGMAETSPYSVSLLTEEGSQHLYEKTFPYEQAEHFAEGIKEGFRLARHGYLYKGD